MNAAAPAPLDFPFEALEHAVRQTTRGHAFLEEYARRIRGNETDRVLNAIEQFTATQAERAATVQIDVLRRELENMAASIVQTRKEIAAIKPEGANHNRINAATEELDQVLRSTETATADILSAAERIQTIGSELKSRGAQAELCDELESQSTNLMLACSFQDLTGQRMNKVVNTLRYLETRVNAMIEIWGITHADAQAAIGLTEDGRPDAHLLNGPARNGEGVDQDDIDKLMNGELAENPAPVVTQASDHPAAPPPAASAGASQSSSQDDIDALFK